jgi:hypothetical protein
MNFEQKIAKDAKNLFPSRTLRASVQKLDYMSTTGSPAKIVWQWRFLNQQIKNGSFTSDYGVHASVLRKPEIIAKHPPAYGRFNNPVTRWCGGALFVCASPRLRVGA